MADPIALQQLAGIRSYSAAFSQLGNDYIFTRINQLSKSYIAVNEPIRVSGMAFCLLLRGNLSIDISSQTYELRPVSLLALSSASLIKLLHVDWENIDAYMLFISAQFLHDININLNVVNFSLIEREPNPVIDSLSDDEIAQLKAYMELLSRNADHNDIDNPYSKNAGRSLIQALIYQLMQIKYEQAHRRHADNDVSQSRRYAYVQDFIRLVQTHHCRERSLAFYAERLFISPKYLSRVIKEHTGRSAAEWIDQFVILEAKNLLRFSNKNIQQVAYALNFSTQSSFGKFFKHMTGMSPSDYQKT